MEKFSSQWNDKFVNSEMWKRGLLKLGLNLYLLIGGKRKQVGLNRPHIKTNKVNEMKLPFCIDFTKESYYDIYIGTS